MEFLPEAQELLLTDVQKLEARLAAASYLNNEAVWQPADQPGLKVKVDIQKNKYDPSLSVETLSAEDPIDPQDPEAGFYRVVATTDNLMIMQEGGDRPGVVTDPLERHDIVGRFATKLQAAIQAAAA